MINICVPSIKFKEKNITNEIVTPSMLFLALSCLPPSLKHKHYSEFMSIMPLIFQVYIHNINIILMLLL